MIIWKDIVVHVNFFHANKKIDRISYFETHSFDVTDGSKCNLFIC